jgi:hypothetical protein
MKRGSLPVMVWVVLTALVLGSFGSAVAAPALTEAAVKKIAAKVVKKKAGNLSVKHAGTATSASTLSGATADQLRTVSYTYNLPVEAAVTQRDYRFPGLPSGTYLVSYTVVATVTSGVLQCQIGGTGGIPYVAGSNSVGTGSTHKSGASAIVSAGPATVLDCSMTSGTFTIFEPAGQRSTVTFTRVDTQTTGTATSTVS